MSLQLCSDSLSCIVNTVSLLYRCVEQAKGLVINLGLKKHSLYKFVKEYYMQMYRYRRHNYDTWV